MQGLGGDVDKVPVDPSRASVPGTDASPSRVEVSASVTRVYQGMFLCRTQLAVFIDFCISLSTFLRLLRLTLGEDERDFELSSSHSDPGVT